MKRYYFDANHHGKVSVDEEGSLLIDVHDARREAVATIRELSADFIKKGETIDDDELVVRCGDGETVLRLLFRDVVV